MIKAVAGLRAWLVQRVSAVFMLLFIVLFLIKVIFDPPRSYSAWYSLVKSPSVSIFTVVFFAALLAHAWVGLRDVIIDYVQPVAFRVGLLVPLGVGLAAMGVWIMRILSM